MWLQPVSAISLVPLNSGRLRTRPSTRTMLLRYALATLVGAAVAAGVLRGVQDTRVPMVIALIGYWGVGFTASVVLFSEPGSAPRTRG